MEADETDARRELGGHGQQQFMPSPEPDGL
jgi:hypothetical protein